MGISIPPSSDNGNLAASVQAENLRKQRLISIGLVLGGLVVLAIVVGLVLFLLQPATDTTKIKESLIILMALEFILIGFTLGLLLLQATKLINLVQNEIKPLLESANETLNTVRGTATFISDAFVQPVLKFNSVIASFRKMLDLLNFNN